ncbi:MAG: 30S ribosomal protein S7 [Bacillota bacterium]|nr:30S ribosomal protein S7 [Bacillota bacterium]MDI7249328.1 30S ribosomal protein S7 [Bacillota bacterium]
MPRRGSVPRRTVAPDPVYGSEMVARLINKVMWDGKKSLAEKIVYSAFEVVGKKSGRDPLDVFEQALKNAMPALEVRPRRVGGATYQVPIEVRPERRVSLGMRWLVQFARARGERTMVERLAGEILDASAGQGGAVKKKEDTHRMAEANRAFAHYRW